MGLVASHLPVDKLDLFKSSCLIPQQVMNDGEWEAFMCHFFFEKSHALRQSFRKIVHAEVYNELVDSDDEGKNLA